MIAAMLRKSMDTLPRMGPVGAMLGTGQCNNGVQKSPETAAPHGGHSQGSGAPRSLAEAIHHNTAHEVDHLGCGLRFRKVLKLLHRLPDKHLEPAHRAAAGSLGLRQQPRLHRSVDGVKGEHVLGERLLRHWRVVLQRVHAHRGGISQHVARDGPGCHLRKADGLSARNRLHQLPGALYVAVGHLDGRAPLGGTKGERLARPARAQHNHDLALQAARAAEAVLDRVDGGLPVGVVRAQAAVGLADQRVDRADGGRYRVHKVGVLQSRLLVGNRHTEAGKVLRAEGLQE
mmetsp:Transcript_40543/g.102609  ORF Transcript_40543/g.102609 Transcript_40543/m.102609 type:complete len:288 (-) Transcript_40543:969-1832(-)